MEAFAVVVEVPISTWNCKEYFEEKKSQKLSIEEMHLAIIVVTCTIIVASFSILAWLGTPSTESSPWYFFLGKCRSPCLIDFFDLLVAMFLTIDSFIFHEGLAS